MESSAEKVAKAILYEGYLLYPYTRPAIKNQTRRTIGGVFPRRYSESAGGGDLWLMQTQCLVEGDTDAFVDIKVRFLHVIDRRILKFGEQGREDVPFLRLGNRVYRLWEEAAEREVNAKACRLGDLVASPLNIYTSIFKSRSEELMVDEAGEVVGAVDREWQEIQGVVEIAADPIDGVGYRLTVRITNETPYAGQDRRAALRHSMISTHTILRALGGRFISLLDPAPMYEQALKTCENVQTWPVLAGEPGRRDTMLSSPIILHDYPGVSPENPGDLFAGAEVDELLASAS